jgi:hypothetical protein
MKSYRKTRKNRKHTGGKEQAEKYNQVFDKRVGRPLTDQELIAEERQYQEMMRREEIRQQELERQRSTTPTGNNVDNSSQNMMDLLNSYATQNRGGKKKTKRTKRTKTTKRRLGSRSKK